MDAAAEIAVRMSKALIHRGPDDEGIWIDGAAGVAFAHRRLSILDLSPAGHQPIVSTNGRYVLVFNGEIYNHLTIRSELETNNCSIAWRGHSDSETLVEAISILGVRDAVRACAGMFAFALWDRRTRRITLARDRAGEKPLYYGWLGKTLVFASELKALRHHPEFRCEVDRRALCLYLRHNYVPGPWSIYEGIFKLPPATLLTMGTGGRAHCKPTPYWSAREQVLSGRDNPIAGDSDEAINGLEQLIKQSVAGQMIADVPVGAFLSGGIDSSVVVALMQAQSPQPIKTFSIGFHEKAYDEAQHARQVARHLGTDHIEVYMTPREALDVVPELPTLYDEPFGDSSQIPTSLIMRVAQRHVKVALSGDAGDELFGGYNRYFWAAHLWRRLNMFPRLIRRSAAAAITAVPPSHWDGLFTALGALLPRRLRYNNPGEKLHRLADMLGTDTPASIYLQLVSHWSPEQLIRDVCEPRTVVNDSKQWLPDAKFEEQMMYLDFLTYLPDDILVKVDRAAMGVSLETRIPLLDHRVIEFAWRLPLSSRIRGSVGKWLLRQLLFRYVPQELVERPKMGFGVPIDHWLRDPLRNWAEALLDEARLRRDGYFDPKPIRRLWNQHLAARMNWKYHIWDILMFQAWLDQARPPSPPQQEIRRAVQTAVAV